MEVLGGTTDSLKGRFLEFQRVIILLIYFISCRKTFFYKEMSKFKKKVQR